MTEDAGGSITVQSAVGAPPGDEGDRFFISCRSEEQPEEKYGRDALLLGLIVLGLFVFGVIFVAATGAF